MDAVICTLPHDSNNTFAPLPLALLTLPGSGTTEGVPGRPPFCFFWLTHLRKGVYPVDTPWRVDNTWPVALHAPAHASDGETPRARTCKRKTTSPTASPRACPRRRKPWPPGFTLWLYSGGPHRPGSDSPEGLCSTQTKIHTRTHTCTDAGVQAQSTRGDRELDEHNV